VTTATRDGRASRWDAPRLERRSRVIEATVALVDERGVEVDLTEIAAHAQIPRSTLYKLFADRQDLDEQVRERIVRDLLERVSLDPRPGDSLRQLFERTVAAYVAWIEHHPHLQRFMTGTPEMRSAPTSAAVAGGRRTFVLRVRDALEIVLLPGGATPAQREVTERTAYAVVGLVESLVVDRELANGTLRSPSELTDFLVATVLSLVTAAASLCGVGLDPDASAAVLG
jgi:AcrR family transcriptional regulator